MDIRLKKKVKVAGGNEKPVGHVMRVTRKYGTQLVKDGTAEQVVLDSKGRVKEVVEKK